MIELTVGVDYSGLNSIRNRLNNIPQAIQTALPKAQRASEPDVMILVADEPRKRGYPQDYPIEWTSDKQRKAYFASDGFGGGIPSKRTGSIIRGWDYSIVNTPNGGALVLENENPAAPYIFGFFFSIKPQQNFHKITGWATVSEQREILERIMVDALSTAILDEINDAQFSVG